MTSGRSEDKCFLKDTDAVLEAVRDKLEWFTAKHPETIFRVTSATMPICEDEGIQIMINGIGENDGK